MENKNKINPLIGEQDYSIWRWRIEALLNEKEVMVHLELQLTAIENGNDPLEGIAVRKNNAILTSLLINRISDNVLLRIHGIEAAGNIWLRLKEMFALTDRAQRQIAKDRYVNPTGATLTDKLHDFEVNVRSYEQAGGRIDEEEKIERAIKIINTQEAKLLQIAVDSQPELFTFDKILRRLHILANKIHRSRITQNQRGSQSARNATNTSARKKGLQCHHCKRFGHVKAQCRNLKCSNCNGFGHFTKDCRVKTEKQANLANRSNTDDEDLLNMNEGQSQVTSSTKTTTYLKELQGFMVDMNRKNEKEKQKLNNNEKTKQKEDKNGKTKQKEHNKKENKKIHRLIFDSGASEHIAPTSLEKYMSNITTIENTKVAGINTSVNTNKKGTLKIKIDDKILKLNEVYLINSNNPILISLGKLATKGFNFEMDDKKLVIQNGHISSLKIQKKYNNLYESKGEVVAANSFYHRLFMHPNEITLSKTLNFYNKSSSLSSAKRVCETCNLCKDTRLPNKSTRKISQTKENERLYGDTVKTGYISKKGKRGFVLLTDSFSKMKFIRTYVKASEVPALVINILNQIKQTKGKFPKEIYCDQGTEFKNKKLKVFLQQNAIGRKFSAKYTPQQNGVSERSNRTVLEKIKLTLNDANISQLYWNYAATYAVYMLNRTWNNGPNGVPFHIFYNKIPDLNDIFRFGEVVYYRKENIDKKLIPKNSKGLYLGPSNISSESAILDSNTRNVVFTRNFRNKYREHSIKTREKGNWSINNIPDKDPYQQFLKIREEDTNEETSHWVRRSPRLKNKSQTAYPITVNFTLAKKLEEYKVQYHDIFSASEVKRNKLPRSFREAMNSEKKNSWLSAYKKELEKFINIAKCKFIHKNNIPQNTRIYNFIEIFTKKYDNIKKKPVYKVRFAADGSQAPPLEPVYSPVSNKESVRIFLAHASACSHRIYQVDITNAYLNASLDNQRFYNLPQIYRSKRKSYVWVSDRAVYGLKESGRKWFLHISASLISFGFTTSDVEMTLFKRRNEDGEYDFILIYVDDILISVKKDYNAHKILRELQSVYDIKSTDKAQNFIGFEIIDNSNTKFISLQNYITNSADLFDLERSKTIETPHQPGVYVLQEDNTINPTLYQRIVGILHFICEMVRPDISFIVNRLAVFTKKPAIEHLRAAKRVLKYLLGTKEYGIHYKKNKKIFEMYIFSDASWKNVTGDLSSLDGHIILLNGGPICWKSKKQKNISKSSTEAEVVGLTRALSTAEWVKNLLTFLEVDKLKVRIFTDSLSTIKLLQGQTLSEKSRHMGVNFFFTRKIIKKNEWQLSHISGLQNPADLFTKPVSKISYLKLRNYLVKKNVSNGRRETG
eukprot:snap_masked-scaffold_5-processed-gene-1.22-mRNA-1 protein AED:1.00 eAED:1.00 QI:0/-1/0/0/-1/1/1/0/1350